MKKYEAISGPTGNPLNPHDASKHLFVSVRNDLTLSSLNLPLSYSSTTRLYTSDYDFYRRQILTYKVGPRIERIKRRNGAQMLYYVFANLGIIKIFN